MQTRQGNYAGLNGASGAHASMSSDRENFDIERIISHPRLYSAIEDHTKITCEQIVENFFKRIRLFTYPLVGIIGALLIYIFSISTHSLDRLNDSVISLTSAMTGVQQTIAAQQRQTDNNSQAIDKLKERLYDGRK